jgi:hypothetical protein
MNERIKELAEQAGFEITPWGNESLPCVHQEGPIDVELKKFAELIVEECAELIDNKEIITAAQTYDEVFVAKFDTKELCAKQIREHFGVNEW